jgi:hypothetical protein
MPVSVISAAAALAAGFGQFAFVHEHHLFGFDVSPSAFKVQGGMVFTLGPEREGFVSAKVSRYGKTLSMRPEPGAPTRIAYETGCLGFSLQYRDGMVLTGEGPAPYLTWFEGSVGPGVPTAKAPWVLMSWGEAKPPILLCFDPPASLDVTATTDGFVLDAGRFSGTVRVRLPFGFEELATPNAAALGAISERLQPLLKELMLPGPALTAAKVFEGEGGVTGVWTFDRAGAVIPPPLVEAVHSGQARMFSKTAPGPSGFVFCAETELRVGFRAARLKPGLGFVYGSAPAGPATISEIDPQSVAEAVLAELGGSADVRTLDALAEATRAFRRNLKPVVEPLTKTSLPFARDGSGSAIAAAHSLGVDAFGRNSSWFDGLAGSLDWVTLLPAGSSEAERIEAASLMAAAGGLRSDPEDRLLAALANAGAGRRGPLADLRDRLYPAAEATPAWFAAILSPIRLLTQDARFEQDKLGFAIVGQADSTLGFALHFVADTPVKVVAKDNIGRLVFVSPGPDAVVFVTPAKPGPWRVVFAREGRGAAIPKASPLPPYRATG